MFTNALKAALLVTLVSASAPAAYAAACEDIVAATIAEMHAGEADWNEQTESLVRRAAGSACVKAMTETAAAGSNLNGPAGTADEDEPDDDKAGWQFLGFDVNESTGSPSTKPYQRKR